MMPLASKPTMTPEREAHIAALHGAKPFYTRERIMHINALAIAADQFHPFTYWDTLQVVNEGMLGYYEFLAQEAL